jgi:hypothetical protein
MEDKFLKIKAGTRTEKGATGISYKLETNMNIIEIAGMLEHIKKQEFEKRTMPAQPKKD